ncbi:MAG: GNAT family N-acetyltransferase, partial [Deltaproteobacteria bacterium]|nr:GNAT family N-acetyltransferase [Deltaproteobacteria bacterium]
SELISSMTSILKANPENKKEFLELLLLSSPFMKELFGDKVLQEMFVCRNNLFSFEHTYFSINKDRLAGMLLGYDWQTRQKEYIRTGILLFSRMGIGMLKKSFLLIRFESAAGKVRKNEYYLSNLAVYNQYQSKGIGRALLEKAENLAKSMHSEWIVLDVERENLRALKFYLKYGYRIERESDVRISGHRKLSFYRMKKRIV